MIRKKKLTQADLKQLGARPGLVVEFSGVEVGELERVEPESEGVIRSKAEVFDIAREWFKLEVGA